MKKQVICAIMLLATGFLFADNIEVRINVVGATHQTTSNDYVFLMQNSWYSAAKDTSDIVKMMNPSTQVNVYAITPLGKLSTMQSDNLIGTFIGFVSNPNTSYTMSFDWLKGGKVYIQDVEQDSIFLATEDVQYNFTATASTTYDARFKIYDVYYPAEPVICHQYGNLIITGHVGDKVKVLKMDDSVAIAEQTIDTDSKVIDLSSLEKGALYQVVIGEKTMIIRVQ